VVLDAAVFAGYQREHPFMLLIPVQLGESPIHGLGVFSVAAIAAGTPVWRFTPGFDLDLDPELVDRQPGPLRRVLLHYGYVDARLRRFILCCDDCRFMNHSDAPNLRVDYAADRYGVDIAARDIAAGEELTVDYRLLEGARPDPG
jgi:SET domain-containing protein